MLSSALTTKASRCEVIREARLRDTSRTKCAGLTVRVLQENYIYGSEVLREPGQSGEDIACKPELL